MLSGSEAAPSCGWVESCRLETQVKMNGQQHYLPLKHVPLDSRKQFSGSKYPQLPTLSSVPVIPSCLHLVIHPLRMGVCTYMWTCIRARVDTSMHLHV